MRDSALSAAEPAPRVAGLGLIALAAAAGALSTLPHVHTEAWWLGILAAAVLAHAVWRLPPRHAAWAGWAFGGAWLAAATWWLFISLNRYGGLAAPLAVAAVAALSSALALYLAAAMWAVARWRSGRAWVDIPAFAAAWLLAELARAVWFTGFPWAAAGYAQVDGPLSAWAPWVGVYGMGALVALAGGGLAWALVRIEDTRWTGRLAPPLAALVLLGLSTALPQDFTRSAGTLTVTLVQTGISQDEKFDPSRLERVLGGLMDALQDARGELVIAPETAVPVLPRDLHPQVFRDLAEPFMASGGQRAALVGVPLHRGEDGYTNSVVAWTAESMAMDPPAYRYDKHHLVPFGEFIPSGFAWFVAMLQMPLGEFSRGAVVQPSFGFRGQRVAPNICYEDLFGEELAQRFHDPAGAPTLMANASNIAWFGPTIAIDQHLHISRLRSLELQRPMVRATNTGATAAIDHRGRVLAWAEPQKRGRVETRVEGREGLTPYAAWVGRLGLWPLWGLGVAGLILAWGLAGRARRRTAGAPLP